MKGAIKRDIDRFGITGLGISAKGNDVSRLKIIKLDQGSNVVIKKGIPLHEIAVING